MSTLPKDNNSTLNPCSSEILPRGWFWSVEPAKTVLATYLQRKSKAFCPKCQHDHVFTKDSNGTGKATYGCFKCKNCFTKYKASLFWTSCLSLPENLLPDKEVACPLEASTTLPDEADDTLPSAAENEQLLICSADESLPSSPRAQSIDSFFGSSSTATKLTKQHGKDPFVFGPSVRTFSPTSSRGSANVYISRKRRAHTLGQDHHQHNEDTSLSNLRLSEMEQNVKAIEFKLSSLESQIQKLIQLLEPSRNTSQEQPNPQASEAMQAPQTVRSESSVATTSKLNPSSQQPPQVSSNLSSPRKPTFAEIAKKNAKTGTREEVEKMTSALRKCVGAKPPFTSTEAEVKHKVCRIYIQGIKQQPIREVKSILYDLRFQLSKIWSIDFIGKTTVEITVMSSYAHAFCAQAKKFPIFKILPKVNPSKPMDPKASPDMAEKIKVAFKRRLQQSYNLSQQSMYKEYLADLAMEYGIYLRKIPNPDEIPIDDLDDDVEIEDSTDDMSETQSAPIQSQ